MKAKSKLFRLIQNYGFVLVEINLYLDGHPYDQAALEYYRKYRLLYDEAVAMYEKSYGPITAGGVESCDSWTWVRDAWPWEYEAN